MRIVSWNVAGLAGLLKKQEDTLTNLVINTAADVLFLQEVKMTEDKVPNIAGQLGLDDFHVYWNCCKEKKGYAGLLCASKEKPLSVQHNLGENNLLGTGRVSILEFSNLYLVNIYTPNSGSRLENLDYRINSWDPSFSAVLNKLQKPIIIAGDLNVAPCAMDVYDPSRLSRTADYTIAERESFVYHLTGSDFIDTWRHLHPNETAYTFYSYRGGMRAKKKGWRIDLALISSTLLRNLRHSEILTDYLGSDHNPILVEVATSQRRPAIVG